MANTNRKVLGISDHAPYKPCRGHYHGPDLAVGRAAGETGGVKSPPDPHYRRRFPVEIIIHAVWL
jgi:hypothetical protein